MKTFDWIRSIQILHIKMVSSNTFDMTANAFGELVNEVCTGTDNNQKAKLKAMLDHFTIICTNAIKQKRNCENNNIQRKKMRLSVIHNILPPEIIENIFRFLNYKEIRQAQLICRKWKGIIENGNLMKKAAGNKYSFLQKKGSRKSIILYNV